MRVSLNISILAYNFGILIHIDHELFMVATKKKKLVNNINKGMSASIDNNHYVLHCILRTLQINGYSY